MQRRFVTCFRDVAIHKIDRKRSILQTTIRLWFLVKRWLRNTETVCSESFETIVIDDVIVLSLRPCGTCKKV